MIHMYNTSTWEAGVALKLGSQLHLESWFQASQPVLLHSETLSKQTAAKNEKKYKKKENVWWSKYY